MRFSCEFKWNLWKSNTPTSTGVDTFHLWAIFGDAIVIRIIHQLALFQFREINVRARKLLTPVHTIMRMKNWWTTDHKVHTHQNEFNCSTRTRHQTNKSNTETTFALLNLVVDAFTRCGRSPHMTHFPSQYTTPQLRTHSIGVWVKFFFAQPISNTYMRHSHSHRVQARRHKINEIYLQAFV